eukprot:scaffold365077_cov25-Prasinocladus_malaysianus.AAC.1
MAISTLLTRLGWPEPIPSSLPSLAMEMALDLTCFTTFHATRMSASISGVGCFSLTQVKVTVSAVSLSVVCASQPPPT